ncbi:MAG: glucosylglycerol hydrolase [Halobellus sp.]|uniref:glucosylglycerol hydrolase n=1 Tax=Halobellus sp. TaxID=1979212 RepID=UPI0035D4BD37
MTDADAPRRLDDRTADLLAWHRELEANDATDPNETARALAERLGAHVVDDAEAVFGFWTPDLVDDGVPESAVFLEILTPPSDADPALTDARDVRFDRTLVPPSRHGTYHWVAVDGVRPGTRETLGSLYQLVYETGDGRETVVDPLCASLPFGAFAPAELYSLDRLDATRADRPYFEHLDAANADASATTKTNTDGNATTGTHTVDRSTTTDVPRIAPPTNVLEIHVGTATQRGTLAGLADVFETVSEKRAAGEPLAAWERNFAGYDAVELLPVEPLTESRTTHDFWTERTVEDDELVARVCRPEIQNWGYDPVVAGASAPNPALLETGRPDELVDFIATCHADPRPMAVVFDVVFGHADTRAVELLSDRFLAGPGPFGKRLNYADPTVRAILLEMLRRKVSFGADGIRIDASHDVRRPDRGVAAGGVPPIDDDFLASMHDIVAETAGVAYRPWTVYEDARPCPQPDWPLTATYRGVTEQHPEVFQWSPLTFGDNTPALLTYWARNWWRIREVADHGASWVTGIANHDTVRRGTQLAPHGQAGRVPVNPHLGDDPRERHATAYDTDAGSVLFHAFLPGVPLDFAHATMRAPWGFFRDTDGDGSASVLADEARFAHWAIRSADFNDAQFFQRTKSFGIDSLSEATTAVETLSSVIEATDGDLDAAATAVASMETPLGATLSSGDLDAFADAWLRDVRDFATLEHWHGRQQGARTAFRLQTREFRRARPWLAADLREEDSLTYRHPVDGSVRYYGYRRAPETVEATEELLFAGNMEGPPVGVAPTDVASEIAADGSEPVPTSGWEAILVPPTVDLDAGSDAVDDADRADRSASTGRTDAVSLNNGEAILWKRVQ